MAYVLLKSEVVGSGGASTFTLSDIPQDYTDLLLLTNIKPDLSGADPRLAYQFNGSQSNYSAWNWYALLPSPGIGNGSESTISIGGTTYGRLSGSDWQEVGFDSAVFPTMEMYIPNYTSTLKKAFTVESATGNTSTTSQIYLMGGYWNDSSAITSITFAITANNIAEHTTFDLYGITAGNDGNTSVS